MQQTSVILALALASGAAANNSTEHVKFAFKAFKTEYVAHHMTSDRPAPSKQNILLFKLYLCGMRRLPPIPIISPPSPF